MLYFENRSTDPAYNLAVEEYLFRERNEDIFLLWRNEPTVVVGRYQETAAEIDPECVARHGIHVVRRISGGGAVYHDLGNLNYTFLASSDGDGFDFARFTEPVIRTLAALGVHAENGGRNDLLIEGKKISGNAQHKRKDRVLHHGTLLFDCDLDRLTEVLRAPAKSYRAGAVKSVPSVRSRVANIVDYLTDTAAGSTAGPIDILAFRDRLLEEVERREPVDRQTLTALETTEIERLRDEKYRSQAWNFGDADTASWNRIVRRRFDWGSLEIRLDIRDGTIVDCLFYGDFFTSGDPAVLADRLVGLPFDRVRLEKALETEELAAVFPAIGTALFLETLFEGKPENREDFC